MNLYLRKDIHLQALDNCRVILKGDGLAVEIGSIGLQRGSDATEYWAWAIDTVIPLRTHQQSFVLSSCRGLDNGSLLWKLFRPPL